MQALTKMHHTFKLYILSENVIFKIKLQLCQKHFYEKGDICNITMVTMFRWWSSG